MSYNIGIDFGGVLSVHDGGNTEHKNTCINIPDAINSLSYLKSNGHSLSLISFCGKTRAYETFDSLKNGGYDTLFDNQFYVKSTNSKSKICKYSGIHIMIDDRVEILDNVLQNGPNKIITIWFGTDEKSDSHIVAKNWEQVLEIISRQIEVNKETKEDPTIDINKLCYIHTKQ